MMLYSDYINNFKFAIMAGGIIMIKLKEEHIDFAAVFISTLLSAIILAIVRESVTGYIDDIVEDTAERAKMKLNNKKNQ